MSVGCRFFFVFVYHCHHHRHHHNHHQQFYYFSLEIFDNYYLIKQMENTVS